MAYWFKGSYKRDKTVWINFHFQCLQDKWDYISKTWGSGYLITRFISAIVSPVRLTQLCGSAQSRAFIFVLCFTLCFLLVLTSFSLVSPVFVNWKGKRGRGIFRKSNETYNCENVEAESWESSNQRKMGTGHSEGQPTCNTCAEFVTEKLMENGILLFRFHRNDSR